MAAHGARRRGDALFGRIGVVDDDIDDRACLELDDDGVDGPVELVAGNPDAVLLAPAGPVDHGSVVADDDAGPRGSAAQRDLADPDVVTDRIDEGDRRGELHLSVRGDFVLEVDGRAVARAGRRDVDQRL